MTMPRDSLSAVQRDLDRFGPDASPASVMTLEEASAYCSQFARSQYENFTVASCLLPAELRPHFYHLYAYCRWADDLADESQSPSQARELLHWWSLLLGDCYRGRATHPVFIALIDTIETFQIPEQPFHDLLHAFQQDQRQSRYLTVAEQLDYCRHSANPVGQLVLYLGRCHDAANVAYSDAICTGLQLANFCQDVARDLDRGRIYIPVECWRRNDYSEAMFERREFNDAFRTMLRGEVDRAQQLLESGWPLARRVPPPLRLEVQLFIRGGLAILEAVRRLDYNVWARRPVLGKLQRAKLLVRAWRAARADRHV